jgi:hypothetical protein
MVQDLSTIKDKSVSGPRIRIANPIKYITMEYSLSL